MISEGEKFTLGWVRLGGLIAAAKKTRGPSAAASQAISLPLNEKKMKKEIRGKDIPFWIRSIVGIN